MKKILFLIAFQFLALGAFAQYQKQDWLFSPKISFADFSDKNNWNGYSINKVPPISLQVEKGINDFLSTGGYVGFYRDKYTNDTLQSNYVKDVFVGLGGQISIHYAPWLEKLFNYKVYMGDWDLYCSLNVRVEYEKNTRNNDIQNDGATTSESEFNFKIGPVFGVRYYLSDRFAMLGEVGTGNLGMITMGISYKFGSQYGALSNL